MIQQGGFVCLGEVEELLCLQSLLANEGGRNEVRNL